VTGEQLDRLIELAGKGELNPVIDRELPLAEAAEAHRLIEARETSFGPRPKCQRMLPAGSTSITRLLN